MGLRVLLLVAAVFHGLLLFPRPGNATRLTHLRRAVTEQRSAMSPGGIIGGGMMADAQKVMSMPGPKAMAAQQYAELLHLQLQAMKIQNPKMFKKLSKMLFYNVLERLGPVGQEIMQAKRLVSMAQMVKEYHELHKMVRHYKPPEAKLDFEALERLDLPGDRDSPPPSNPIPQPEKPVLEESSGGEEEDDGSDGGRGSESSQESAGGASASESSSSSSSSEDGKCKPSASVKVDTETRSTKATPCQVCADKESHPKFLKKIKELGNKIQVVFAGDSFMDGWETQLGNKAFGSEETDAVWTRYFSRYTPLNLGVAADRTENLLWRLQNGEAEGYQAKLLVLMIGVNNLVIDPIDKVADVVNGVKAVTSYWQTKQCKSKVLLLGLLPRSDKPEVDNKIKEVNLALKNLQEGDKIRFHDLRSKVPPPTDEKAFKEMFPNGVHANTKAYTALGSSLAGWIDDMIDEDSDGEDDAAGTQSSGS